MPSNNNSRAPASKNSSRNATSKPNGAGQVVSDVNATSSSLNQASSQNDVASTRNVGQNSATQNGSGSHTLQTAVGGPEGFSEATANGAEDVAPAVNRKKQKRRQKQAARLAAEQSSATDPASSQPYIDDSTVAYKDLKYAVSATQAQMAEASVNGYQYGPLEYDNQEYEPGEGEDLYYTDEDDRLLEKPYSVRRTNGIAHDRSMESSTSRTRKKKNRSGTMPQTGYPQYDAHGRPYRNMPTTHQAPPPPPPPPALSNAAYRSAHHISKDRIWNTSTAEERERIKEFWLSLGEEDRRSLVKVEKEAVLKKMKEQQKHSCSCTVCGRKRTAIEEELEVLYDAYYEELEQYANHQQINLDDGTPMMHPPRIYGHPMGRLPPRRTPQGFANHSSRGRIQEVPDEEDDGDDEEYDEEEDEDEDISDGEPEEPMGHAPDFFNFGNSLTVQGGILTVADDLLKNDGKKFIEMMEQLAERRMQREEEQQYQSSRLHHPSTQPHNHGPPLEDEGDYDEEDEEDYDSQEEEEYEDDEMEAMTEEQRMEEGRRMFQIFAARMFEQRVLTAYREKVARERQQKLMEELDEEKRLDTQREAKKAKEAQKKKDKKKQQKLAKDEEKAKREAEKAAEEAAQKAVEDKRLEEQRQKKEEQRKKREAEKKAQEEERQRKEAEKQKRLQDARDQQAELERKQREQKEREKKKREELRRKEREEREAKEQKAREKKEREAAERRERENRAKSEREEKEKKKAEEQATKQSTPAPVVPTILPSTKPNITIPSAPQSSGLVPPHTTSNHVSPHLPVATPVVPKAPTPIRPRQASIQGSHSSSPKTSVPPPESSTTSPSMPSQSSNVGGQTTSKTIHHSQTLLPPQQVGGLPPSIAPGPPTQPPGFSGPPTMAGTPFPASFAPMMPNVSRGPTQDTSMFHHPGPFNGVPYRPFMAPNGLPYPPGINGLNMMRPIPQGRSGPMEQPSPPVPIGPNSTNNMGQYLPRDTMPSHSHSRQSSASYDKSTFDNVSLPAQTQPITRPAPIQRPSSVAPHQQSVMSRKNTHVDVDDLSNHLGSSALLDDTDVPLSSNSSNSRRGSMAPGGSRPARHGFNGPLAMQDPIGTAKLDFARPAPLGDGLGNNWNPAQGPLTGPPLTGPAPWSNTPRPGWPTNNAFGLMGGPPRPSTGSRAVTIRLLVCQACNKLSAHPPPSSRGGYHNVQEVLRTVEMMKPSHEGPISMDEMLIICDTEGNSQNGGGSFIIESHGDVGAYVRFESARSASMSMAGALGPGDIGSPVPGGAMPAFARGFQQSGF